MRVELRLLTYSGPRGEEMCSLWGPGVIAALSTHREVVLVMNANTTLEMRVLHVKGRERVCVQN